MGRQATDALWVSKIEEITENNPRLGPKAVLQRLEKDPECAGQDEKNWPSESTVGRIQRKFRQKPDEERRLCRWFYWPESCERGDLPWEASEAALELLRFWQRGSPTTRPSVRLARWFWRITQAAPNASDFERRHYAGWLAAAEAVGADVRRGVERWLCGQEPSLELEFEGATPEALSDLMGGWKFGGGRWFNGETGQSGEIRPEEEGSKES